MANLYETLKQKFCNFDCKSNHLNIDQNRLLTTDNFPHCNLDINIEQLKKCAVLIILFRKNKEFNILFTIRSSELRSFPGEICFPGGNFDPLFDRNLEDTAFRETTEEIGLSKKNLDLVCQLCPFISPVGHFLVPFICILKRETNEDRYEETSDIVSSLKPNPNEVQSIFSVPFSYILDPYFVNERLSVMKVSFKPSNILQNIKDLISDRLDFSNGYLNRIFINLDESLFESNKLPVNSLIYGINATVVLFVALKIQNNSEFNFKIDQRFFLTSKTVDEYISLFRFVSYILYRNYLIERIYMKPKL